MLSLQGDFALKKEEVIKKVEAAGDAVIMYKSQNSHKIKYNVCTLDFDSEYIKSKPNKTKPSEDDIVFFCWDTDSYRMLKIDLITGIVPLSRFLKGF